MGHLVEMFFAGIFLSNSLPHFVKGICGDRFPTPFAKPLGKGLSSPLVNVAWSLFNMAVAALLLRVARPRAGAEALVAFCVGFAAYALCLPKIFEGKYTA